MDNVIRTFAQWNALQDAHSNETDKRERMFLGQELQNAETDWVIACEDAGIWILRNSWTAEYNCRNIPNGKVGWDCDDNMIDVYGTREFKHRNLLPQFAA